MPPPTSGLPRRLVLGPALRAQPDGRLVRLVREGYESAFEEIVRRYRRPLDRFAASIVGGRSEDVTQDSFRKALEALRRGDDEVELRPWLYRIVRNTALNDLRDRPPAAAELAEDLVAGGRSAAVEAEERSEVATLTARLRALPDNQRAALVMRELEGMGHEEIADALGVSKGAARQAIARGRAAARSGFGALLPLPLLRVLAGGADGGSAEAAAGAGAAAGGAVGGGAAMVGAGGLGVGALKVGLATVVVAGSIGAGVAIQHHGGTHRQGEAAKADAPAPGGPSDARVRSTPSPVIADRSQRDEAGAADGADSRSGHGDGDHGDDQPDGSRSGGTHRGGPGSGGEHRDSHGGEDDDSGSTTNSDTPSSSDSHGGPNPHGSGSDSSGTDEHDGSGGGSPDRGSLDGGGSGRDAGSDGAGDGSSDDPSSHGGSQPSGSTSGGSGSDDTTEPVVGSTPAGPSPTEPASSGGPGPSSSSGGGSSGSSSGGSSGPSDSGSSGGGSPGGSGSSGGGSGSSDDS
jgi:RNA polymerase sigma factor (sigma-70 family)